VNSISFLFPELLLVVVPLLLLYRWRGRSSGPAGVTRIIAIVVLTLIAAVPLARLGGNGLDLVVVADLSHSMPSGSQERMLEVIRLVEGRRGTGDRVGIVTFGRNARIERLPEEQSDTSAFVHDVDSDGSDLGAAVSLAASLISPTRAGRLLVLSDGEANGEPFTAAAHEAAVRGVPIDFRPFGRSEGVDVAIDTLDLPGVIDQREPFQFSASVRADRTADAEAVLTRDGVEIARSSRTVQPGVTQFTFRDVLDRPGVARYRLEVHVANDRVPENNVGIAAARAEAPATVLLVNATGGPDNFSRALAAGGLNVTTATPRTMPRDLASLQGFRAVVLENIAASDLGAATLGSLARFANELGGGLLVTGGAASFGVGGYFKSELDEHLPVSMEVKNEHRKLSMAMVVVLDRSGSMAVPAGDGRTKMDLANLGTCAAIETLGPYDEVGVIAVDSAPHVVSPLVSAEDREQICSQVRRIQSMGGGIFTYTALVTAAKMVQESDKGTRHIVLFADAADAEEPGEYERLLATLQPLGITVSVIGLGSDSDTDAAFLKDVAMRGGGRILFTANVDELPRLFAQEAITAARSSFITEPTNVSTLKDMVLLGDLPASAFPAVDAYNLSYLRPGATIGAVTTDEYAAPVFAFWHRGLGRVAALTTEVDGKYSARINAWGGFPGFAAGVGRWLLGGDPPIGVQATFDRQGSQGIIRVELDPDRPRGGADAIRSATAALIRPGGAATDSDRLPLSWVGNDTLEARFPMQNAGVYVGAVQLGSGHVLSLPPLTLPYSPEFAPRADPTEGRRALSDIARLTGGIERTAWDDVFDAGARRNRQVRDLVIPLTLLLLFVHLVEISGRRLLLFASAQAWLRSHPPSLRRFARWRPTRPADPSPVTRPAAHTPPTAPATDTSVEPAVAAEAIASSLARAKAKARDRVER
jgi:hypothetical protein